MAINKVTWQQVGHVTQPGRYMFRFGWLTIAAEDLAIWEQFPDAVFALVKTAAMATDETATVAEFHQTYKAKRSACCGCPLHPWAMVVAALVFALLPPRTKKPPAAGVAGVATVKVTVMLEGEP